MVRIGVDIGGTFTDLVLQTQEGTRFRAKLLTTTDEPERAVMDGLADLLAQSRLGPGDVQLIIHGTTLAANALIERRGTDVAFITTAGHRDILQIATESRFHQFDLFIEKPEPLVPRHRRFPVSERIGPTGEILLPLDRRVVDEVVDKLAQSKASAVAIGFLNSYVNSKHELAVAAAIREALPQLDVTLSHEVSGEMREYERFSTACANAYIRPLMASYLDGLAAALARAGFRCPLFLMLSGGGITTLEVARRFPVRLVESGPAGGAIFASDIGKTLGEHEAIAFDMGGTTAKLCLVDDGEPATTRNFEVARRYRFLKGSGLPLRLPAIELVEIGAGGGSIGSVDQIGRVAVGPESAGSHPGPACYGFGGERPTITDANVATGFLDPTWFAGGRMQLLPELAAAALDRGVGSELGVSHQEAARAMLEIVDENMASAARMHAIEHGRELGGRTLVASGGAAPLHAARLAEKLGIDRIVIPVDAGVGSAVGFLKAPVSFEAVRSRYMRLSSFDAAAANGILAELNHEVMAVVAQAAPISEITSRQSVHMRFVGQGFEIAVPLPSRALDNTDADVLRTSHLDAYTRQFGATRVQLDIEILAWRAIAIAENRPAKVAASLVPSTAQTLGPGAKLRRSELAPGTVVRGPSLIHEDTTTTVVTAEFTASIHPLGHIVLTRTRSKMPSP
jgi:N-methylhydantoinase A